MKQIEVCIIHCALYNSMVSFICVVVTFKLHCSQARARASYSGVLVFISHRSRRHNETWTRGKEFAPEEDGAPQTSQQFLSLKFSGTVIDDELVKVTIQFLVSTSLLIFQQTSLVINHCIASQRHCSEQRAANTAPMLTETACPRRI